MADYSLIRQHIFIGNIVAAIGNYQTKESDILEKENISVVISALTEEEYAQHMITEEDFPNCTWYRLVMDDDPNENINKYFHQVHKIISAAVKENNNVLVHCSAGMSRSPTLVIAYLMIENRWTYDEAIAAVKKRRSIIAPNKGFIKQLRDIKCI